MFSSSHERAIRICLTAIAASSLLALAGIVIFLFTEGLPLFRHVSPLDFLLGDLWYPTEDPGLFGIFPLLVGSVAVTVLSSLLAVPLGVMTAVYLAEIAPPFARRIIKPFVELLAALPSVVLGFLGMVVLAPILQDVLGAATGLNLLNASLVLAIMSLPTICSVSEDALRAAAPPRGVWKQLPLTALPLQNAGNDIARHLRGCDAMVLMAVTLGSGADTLMRRLELTDIALAAVVDAMASAVMEELCNALEAEIRTSVQAQGHYLTGRFSPGYGDCPLTLQQPFAIALDTVRGLGMAVTPENLLTPRKSVTAILGVADHLVTGARAGCGHCLLREKCEYRKRGTTCEN